MLRSVVILLLVGIWEKSVTLLMLTVESSRPAWAIANRLPFGGFPFPSRSVHHVHSRIPGAH
jgi:hypothetical protein